MAARTIEEMVSKGEAKLRLKVSTMASRWAAKKSQMKTNYGALPFGPLTKAAYNQGLDAAIYRAPDPARWSSGFRAGASA